jgi:hypothetical protein
MAEILLEQWQSRLDKKINTNGRNRLVRDEQGVCLCFRMWNQPDISGKFAFAEVHFWMLLHEFLKHVLFFLLV